MYQRLSILGPLSLASNPSPRSETQSLYTEEVLSLKQGKVGSRDLEGR